MPPDLSTEDTLHYPELTVEVLRGGIVESRHRVCASVRFASGKGGLTFGDPDAGTFWRSALKPFQALAIVTDGVDRAFGFGPEEMALVCASHGGTPTHLDRVREILAAIGKDPEVLHCGPHTPYDSQAAAELRCAGERPNRLHNNCSGKHASMLALALHHGWSTDGYWRYDHPVQTRVRQLLSEWIGKDPETLEWATDGCGVPTPWGSLADMAMAYARLVHRAVNSGPPAATVVGTMTRYPDLTSSPGREPLQFMSMTFGRLLAKEGAEGVLCIAGTDSDWGMALKVEDGARRAVGPAAVEILTTAGLLSDVEQQALQELAMIPILSARGEMVGEIRARPLVATDKFGAA
jgi:L-asparaginase II